MRSFMRNFRYNFVHELSKALELNIKSCSEYRAIKDRGVVVPREYSCTPNAHSRENNIIMMAEGRNGMLYGRDGMPLSLNEIFS